MSHSKEGETFVFPGNVSTSLLILKDGLPSWRQTGGHGRSRWSAIWSSFKARRQRRKNYWIRRFMLIENLRKSLSDVGGLSLLSESPTLRGEAQGQPSKGFAFLKSVIQLSSDSCSISLATTFLSLSLLPLPMPYLSVFQRVLFSKF